MMRMKIEVMIRCYGPVWLKIEVMIMLPMFRPINFTPFIKPFHESFSVNGREAKAGINLYKLIFSFSIFLDDKSIQSQENEKKC